MDAMLETMLDYNFFVEITEVLRSLSCLRDNLGEQLYEKWQ
jgi:hypothetical protein